MPNITCPQCHAELDNDLRESTGGVECPFCGADVPELAAATLVQETPADAGQISLPPLPSGSVIQVIQATPERRVFYIPGGRSGGIGFFALVWNGFMAVFTTVMVSSFLGGQQGDLTVPMMIAFLSLFWLVGLGFAYWWFKAKFERLFVMIEPGRIVIQRVLLSRKRIDETALQATSRAELVESYKSNDNPVYRVEVAGANGAAKFATSLERDEKNWLVDRINEFLHPAGMPPTNAAAKFCSQCGESLQDAQPDPETGAVTCSACGTTISTAAMSAAAGDLADAEDNADIDTAELTQPADVIIDEQRGDHLKFHLPICSHATLAWVVAGFSILFGMFFIGMAVSGILDLAEFDLFKTVFFIPFLLGGLAPISLGLLALRGRITVDLTPQRIKVRYHLGFLGKSKEMATDQITEVNLMTGSPSDSRVRNASNRSNTNHIAACVVKSAAHMIPLTLIHDKPTARYITQLVRRQLREMGVQFSSK